MRLGRHTERPDIRALGRTGGTDLIDVTICHPLSQARIRDAVQNPLSVLKAALAGKVSRYGGMVQEDGGRVNVLPVKLFTLGGWHPDVHLALCSAATAIAAICSGNVHIQLGYEHFVPVTCCISREEHCSFSHFRLSVRYLRRIISGLAFQTRRH